MNNSNLNQTTSVDSKIIPMDRIKLQNFRESTSPLTNLHSEISLNNVSHSFSIPLTPLKEIEALLTASLPKQNIEPLMENLIFSKSLIHISHLNDPKLLNFENALLDFGGKNTKQNVMVPSSTQTRFIVEYGECSKGFCGKSYKKSNLCENNVSETEFFDTLNKAEEILEPTRGKISRLNLISAILLTAGFLAVAILAICLGKFVKWYIGMIIGLIYLLFIIVWMVCVRRKSTELIKFARVALALLVRSENNRIYLKKKVLVRPGRQAKWIEFSRVPPKQSKKRSNSAQKNKINISKS